MRTVVVSLVLAPAILTLSAFAHAKPAPLDPRDMATSPDDTVIESGPSGATLESNYFNAPPAPFTAERLMPCRLQFDAFAKTRLAKTRLARSCN